MSWSHWSAVEYYVGQTAYTLQTRSYGGDRLVHRGSTSNQAGHAILPQRYPESFATSWIQISAVGTQGLPDLPLRTSLVGP